MSHAEWMVNGDYIQLSLCYQKQNETSSGTSGCSSNWGMRFTDLEETAKELIRDAGKVYDLKQFPGVDDWKKLLPKEV